MKKWKDIKNKRLSPKKLEELNQEIQEELDHLTLQELRKLSGKTQTEMADLSSTTQAQLSRVEARTDHRLSTIRRYVEALGGELEVVALINGQKIILRNV